MNFKIYINLISNPLSMVYIKFHNMKRKKNSNVTFILKQILFFFLLIFQLFSTNQNNIKNMSTIKVHKVQINVQFFFCSIYALSIFPKNVPFFFFFFFLCRVQQCSSFFSSFFPYLFTLSGRPLFFLLFF